MYMYILTVEVYRPGFCLFVQMIHLQVALISCLKQVA